MRVGQRRPHISQSEQEASHQNKVKAIIKEADETIRSRKDYRLNVSDVFDTKPNYFALDERDLWVWTQQLTVKSRKVRFKGKRFEIVCLYWLDKNVMMFLEHLLTKLCVFFLLFGHLLTTFQITTCMDGSIDKRLYENKLVLQLLFRDRICSSGPTCLF